MKISDKGLAFIAGHEGFVSTAYRDPVGVLTIGYGFTMRSQVFSAWWRTRHGRSLRMGDAISRADAEVILKRLVDEEYGAAVTARLGSLPQHQYDAACSVAYNLGPRALTWRWARALKAGDPGRAAAILRDNYNTARGRKLPGLVRRRREEAQLLLTGIFPGFERGNERGAETAGNDLRMLRTLGYAQDDLEAATRAFQRTNPPLAVDGLFGPKTRKAAERQLRAASESRKRETGWLDLLPVLTVVLALAPAVTRFAKTAWRRLRGFLR
ncbi:lysozyme [Stappia sp. ES.058]|uniref:lysozyme n=1 Tax=Stappia sp. ES.058 TaxID=1881061 RepID=UPI00087CC91F|nr:lysozyme [Stappia sp. ES.058]SDT99153.1 Phage-related lysozyme (muramidase), GH24 family [Stappia sp. ES.058]